jgi:hypothetical protein
MRMNFEPMGFDMMRSQLMVQTCQQHFFNHWWKRLFFYGAMLSGLLIFLLSDIDWYAVSRLLTK